MIVTWKMDGVQLTSGGKKSGVDEICEFVARNTEKCPSSVPSGVHIMRVNLMRRYIISFSSGQTKLSVINGCRKSGFLR